MIMSLQYWKNAILTNLNYMETNFDRDELPLYVYLLIGNCFVFCCILILLGVCIHEMRREKRLKRADEMFMKEFSE